MNIESAKNWGKMVYHDYYIGVNRESLCDGFMDNVMNNGRPPEIYEAMLEGFAEAAIEKGDGETLKYVNDILKSLHSSD